MAERGFALQPLTFGAAPEKFRTVTEMAGDWFVVISGDRFQRVGECKAIQVCYKDVQAVPTATGCCVEQQAHRSLGHIPLDYHLAETGKKCSIFLILGNH
jgi:hypothetical protein